MPRRRTSWQTDQGFKSLRPLPSVCEFLETPLFHDSDRIKNNNRQSYFVPFLGFGTSGIELKHP